MTSALWTGQRKGDLLALTWANYDGKHIRLTQNKTGKRVTIPVGAPLRAELETHRQQLTMSASEQKQVHILRNSHGQPWTAHGFGTSWKKGCAAAGVVGLTFHDLRGTAVTRLAVAGCSEAEIATITGHSMIDVGTILDTHYLHCDAKMAESAINKLARSLKTPN